MKPGWRAALLISLLMALASCGDKSTAPRPDQIAGTWNATALVYASKTTSDRVDLIANGGSETLVLGADRSFSLMRALPGAAPDTLRGNWEISGDVGDLMVLHIVSGELQLEWAFDFALNGDTMSLSVENSDYDFNTDGAREAARMKTTFARAS